MYEKFTDRSRKVMQLAAKTAKQRGDFYLGIHHMLIALVQDGSGLAANVLKHMGVDVESIIAKAAVSEPACGEPDILGHLLHTPNTKKALDHAKEIAETLGHNYVGTEHLLLGLLKTQHPVVTEVLNKAGVDYKRTYETVTDLLTEERNTPSKEEIAINYYRGVLRRILKTCEQPSDDTNDDRVSEIHKIAKRAILDGGKWNIS